jgi:hypothetical protein
MINLRAEGVLQGVTPVSVGYQWRLNAALLGAQEPQAGGMQIPLEGRTESELLAIAQQRAAEDANTVTENIEAFTVDDVRGGAY